MWLIPPADQSEKFVEASKKGNLIPVYRSIFSDHLTPVLAYRCLVKEDDRDAPSFLYESVEPGSKDSNVVSPLSLFHICICLGLTLDNTGSLIKFLCKSFARGGTVLLEPNRPLKS